MPKKISIALATYNGERFLRELLDSLCNQTLLPDEIVVSDDCSKDSTLSIIEEYKGVINIVVVLHSTNIGVNKNFEDAIKTCTGEYVMICDQDDIWMPTKIEDTFKRMEIEENKGGVDKPILISSQVISFSSNSKITNEYYECNGIISGYKQMLFGKDLCCQGCTMMMNRSLIKKLHSIPDNFKDFPYDGYIAMIACAVGEHIHIVQPMLYYRHHQKNVLGKIQNVSLKKRIEIKLRYFTYSFFYTPQDRIRHLRMLPDLCDGEFVDDYIPYYIGVMEQYVNVGLLKKIRLIFRMKDIKLIDRIKHFATLVALYPCRLFVNP